MLRYVARRILLMIPTLFIISALVYFIIDLPPGDCVTSQIDELLSLSLVLEESLICSDDLGVLLKPLANARPQPKNCLNAVRGKERVA